MKQVHFIEEVKQIVERNINHPNLKGQFIANELNISRMHLHRQLKMYCKQSASEFILEIRINKAKELLLDANIPILMISKQLGFKDPSYFSKVFKKAIGVTPSNYKKHEI